MDYVCHNLANMTQDSQAKDKRQQGWRGKLKSEDLTHKILSNQNCLFLILKNP